MVAYPFGVGVALWFIHEVATAKDGFWATSEFGLVMLAFALSSLALGVLRLGDGRFETEKGKTQRRSARYAAGVWLAAFALTAAAFFAFALLKRLPSTLTWPPEVVKSCNCPADGKADPPASPPEDKDS